MVLSSSIREVGEAVDALVRKNEIFTVPADSVASVLSESEVSSRQYFMFRLELAAHAIECNQHNEDQAASGKTWLAQQLDIPEHLAGSHLSGLKKLALHPDVLEEARNGALSFEKASMIARVADGSASCEEEMMAHAHSESYEQLRKRGLDFKATKEDSDARQLRLRKSQYIRATTDDDGLTVGSFRFLPGNALSFMSLYRQAELEAVRTLNSDDNVDGLELAPLMAEAFARNLGETGGSSKPGAVVNFHVRLEDDGRFPDHAEVPGIGFMPISVLNDLAEHPLLRLIIEAGNKVLFYSSKKYKPDGPLMQWQKDMAEARAFDICQTPGCTKPSTECDHIKARDKGGTNEPANTQGLCDEDHDAKTRKDAPWTAGGIYGRKKRIPGLDPGSG